MNLLKAQLSKCDFPVPLLPKDTFLIRHWQTHRISVYSYVPSLTLSHHWCSRQRSYHANRVLSTVQIIFSFFLCHSIILKWTISSIHFTHIVLTVRIGSGKFAENIILSVSHICKCGHTSCGILVIVQSSLYKIAKTVNLSYALSILLVWKYSTLLRMIYTSPPVYISYR